MAASLNEESVEKKLKTVNNTQDSIQSLSLWIIHHKFHHEKIVELWMRVMKKTVQPSHRLTLFYLCNDVVQTCKKKKAYVYNTSFKQHLTEAAGLVRDASVKGKIERIFKIWEERGVYDALYVKTLNSILDGKLFKSKDKKKHRKHAKLAMAVPRIDESDGQSVKSTKRMSKQDLEESGNGPISPPGTPYAEFIPQPAPVESQETENTVERDAEESARILAEFKPHEMIDQITTFQRHQSEIQLKVNQLSHLKLDASSIEAIKHLKDRAHGHDFSSHFEDSSTKLKDLVARQSQQLEDQMTLVKTLQTSETFYEVQYREAKIVANAYKNFGARINNMKKKLDDLKKSMPEPDSPIPSPDVNAPSPGNTPPLVATSGYGYNPAVPIMDYQPNDSPPLEAPSPEGSPPDLNLGSSDTTSANFESRLASFFDQSRHKNSSNPPVYTPRLASSSSKSYKLGDEDGGMTPLDDETPTTPVQDEHTASPPKRNTPPKKENPIDFLSRLISQTQKTPAPTTKSGASSILDSLSLLSKPPTTVEREAPSVDSVNNSQSWTAWKAKSNEISTSPSQPTSPTQFPRAPPTMVPPPMPMPVPPPIALTMSLTMPPPPPPPPFTLTAGLPPPHFGSPPPRFQQTSPGQKENWPEPGLSQASDVSGSGRALHNSVLKELVPAEGFDAKLVGTSVSVPKASSSIIDTDAMEIVSEEEVDDMGSEDDKPIGDAKAEFAQKLKQKTAAQGNVKSHVFVPNPERPNLMTLTVPDDLDEEDMIDDNTVMEDAPSWSSRSRKSSHKSRSRSHSREKERSHKHKKKKKHKRSHSDEESPKGLEVGEDGKGYVESIVKRIDSRSGSRNSRDSNGKSEKYEEKYDDRKYDRYDDRDYGGRDHKRGHRGSRDSRDPVEAYTLAYRDAMFQQFNQGRFSYHAGNQSMDPRRSGYGKY